MSFFELNTRVTLGIILFPSCTSGFTGGWDGLGFTPAIYAAGVASSISWLLSTTELMGKRVSSRFRFGIVNLPW
jgi:hypothetical protein